MYNINLCCSVVNHTLFFAAIIFFQRFHMHVLTHVYTVCIALNGILVHPLRFRSLPWPRGVGGHRGAGGDGGRREMAADNQVTTHASPSIFTLHTYLKKKKKLISIIITIKLYCPPILKPPEVSKTEVKIISNYLQAGATAAPSLGVLLMKDFSAENFLFFNCQRQNKKS